MTSVRPGSMPPPAPPQALPTHRVTARVVGSDFYLGAIESHVFPQYEVEFANTEAYAVRISRYKATWPGNHRELVLQDFVLAPGERRTTTFVTKPDGNSRPSTIEEITLEWTAERAP